MSRSTFEGYAWIAQVVLVVCLSASMSCLVAALNFRSPLNIFWMLLLPLVLGLLLNRDARRQTMMALVLLVASGAGMVIADYLFGIY